MKLILAAALLLSGQEKVELKWSFEKGRELTYKQTQKQTLELFGSVMDQETSQILGWKVTDVAADGTATIETTCLAIAMKAAGAMEFEYDSDKDKELPENPQVRMMAKMVGKTFTIKMTPKGKILESKGVDALLDDMLKEFGDDAGPMREMLKQMLSDDTMKSSMQQMAPMLPQGPVAKGDKWKDEFTLKFPMIGGMKFGVASTLQEVGGGQAKVDQDWTIELKAGEENENPLGAVFKITDSKGKAQLVFSLDKGHFISQQIEMTMTMEANGQQIPVKTKSEMKLVDRPKKKF